MVYGLEMHNQLLAMVFNPEGHVVTGWYPSKAFDLGDFDGAEEQVRCTFRVNREAPFSVPADCRNSQPNVGKEQSGTIVFAMKKDRFAAIAKPKGEPKPIPENGD